MLPLAPLPARLAVLPALLGLLLSGTAGAAPRPLDRELPGSMYGPNSTRTLLDFYSRPDPRFRSPFARNGGTDLQLEGFNESSVAINPTNPMNIAYASLWELRVSNDGGATFEPPVLPAIPTTHIPQGDPVVAFDSAGRLLWTYIGSPGLFFGFTGTDIFVAECDPGTGAIIAGPFNVTEAIGRGGAAGFLSDKQWMAVDSWSGSPFKDRIYLAWTDFPVSGPTTVYSTFSSDQGATWSPPLLMGGSGNAFKWPVHLAVAKNGDVYFVDHRQPTFNALGVPDGMSGRIHFRRSTDGGVSFPQSTDALPGGQADLTFNVQSEPMHAIPGTDFLLQGGVHPWVLPDPNTPGVLYVVAADDPDNMPIFPGDASNVYLTRSTDDGLTWEPRIRVDSGPGTTFAIMPSAAIDPTTGTIVVTWYDSRAGATNANGNLLLDTYAAVSLDGGQTFGQDFLISDTPFDPDAGATCHQGCPRWYRGNWVAGPNDAYLVSTLSVYHWDGVAWTEVATGVTSPDEMWGAGADDMWVVGFGGEIAYWDGAVWTLQASGTTEVFQDVYGRSATEVYAVGRMGLIAAYDGSSWSLQSSGTTESLFGVYPAPGGDVWAVGVNGTVLRNNGSGWTAEASGTTEALMGVWASSNTDVWAVGQNGTIYHRDGSGWSAMASGAVFLSGVFGFAPDDVTFVGMSAIIHWDGSTLSRTAVSEHKLFTVHGSSPSDLRVGGDDAVAARYDGSAWAIETTPAATLTPTLRIGEYNGTAVNGIVAVTWTGNTDYGTSGALLGQQSVFDTFAPTVQTDAPDIASGAALVVLEPGSPNPFRWVTRIAYSVPQEQSVLVTVHDVAGRRLATLEEGLRSSGRHELTWDGRDQSGRAVSAGVYFARLEAGEQVQTTKVVLSR